MPGQARDHNNGERTARGHGRANGAGGLADLAGGGASRVSLSSAMRAREVSRPTDDDLAAAIRDADAGRDVRKRSHGNKKRRRG